MAHLRAVLTLVLAGAAAAALATPVLTAPAAAAPPAALDQAGLAALRDRVALAAPVGSASHVDPATGTVVVHVPGAAPAAVTAAAGSHAHLLRVVPNAGEVRPASALYGGVRMETTFTERWCSTGLFASGGGWLWMLTAGHCVAGGIGNSAVWFSSGGYTSGGLIGVGTILDPVFPGSDYGAIQISRISPFTPQPAVLESTGQVRNIQAIGNPVVYQPPRGGGGSFPTPLPWVCKTGQTTGTTCGLIRAVDVSTTTHFGVIGGLIATSACAAGGDSGSPLYDQDPRFVFVDGALRFLRHGYGVLSASSVVACSDPNYRSYFQPATEILAAYGLTPLLS